MDDADHAVIGAKRGDHNRLGFALQLTTARFLGTFLEDPVDVPGAVLQTLVRQLRITNLDQLSHYRSAEQRWERYREGQEDQLGALGLVLNIIVLWNTIYIDAALAQLRQEGYPVRERMSSGCRPLCMRGT